MKSTPRGSGEGTGEGVRRRDGGAAERRIAADAFKAFWPDWMGVAMRRSCRAAAAISCACAGEGGRPRARAPPILAAACRAPRRHYVAPPARRPANRPPLRRAPRAQSRVRGSAGQVPASSTRDGGLERRRAARSGGGCNGGKARQCDCMAGLFRPAFDIVRAAIRGGRPRRSSRRGTPPRARCRYLPAARGRRPAGGLGPCPAIAFSRFWAAACAPTRGPHPLNRPPSSRPASRTVLGAAPGWSEIMPLPSGSCRLAVYMGGQRLLFDERTKRGGARCR